jgi:F-type H+-transporting ATPase subunit a
VTGALLAAARPGFKTPTIEDFQWPCLTPNWKIFGFGLCVNREVLLILLAGAVVLVLFLIAFRNPQMIPTGLQNFMEVVVDFVRNAIVLEVIGHEGLGFVPYLTTVMFFVFVGNVFGIIPGLQFPVNSHMAIPIFLAMMTWVLFNAVGIRRHGWGGYSKMVLFPAGVPWPMYILVTPIEFVSTILVRPVTLSVRLLANMIAGHLLLTIFFLGTAYLLQPSITALFAAASFALGTALVAFELFVAALQAYIFTILTAVYLAGALSSEH